MAEQPKPRRSAPPPPQPVPANAPDGAANNRPVHEERMGRVVAAVWQHTGDDGKVWFNVTVSRVYKDKDGRWARADSFGKNDLPLLAKVADRCHSWIYRNPAEE